MLIEVKEYLDESGKSFFSKWFDSLEAKAAAKIVTAIARLEQGNFSNVKGVGNGVYERAIDYGPGYRIYFAKEGETIIVLLGSGSKKQQQQDINSAKEHWQLYKKLKRIKNSEA